MATLREDGPGLSGVGLPAESFGRPHSTKLNGLRLFWVEAGAGEPLILLHGLGDSHRTWRRLAPLLAPRYRVLLPDLAGHGLSGRPDAPYTLDWHVEVVAEWMDRIGVTRAHLCGHSYGGGVAQWLLLKHRDRVDRLALVSPGGLGREVTAGLRFVSLPLPEAVFSPTAMALGTRLVVRLDASELGHPEPSEIETMARMNGLPGSGRAFRRSVRGVINVLGQAVQTCRQAAEAPSLPPIALFWGERDRVIPVEHGRVAVERYRGATLTVYPGCGHYAHLQEPALLARDLLEFLGDPARPPARIEFACPGGPRHEGSDALPVGQCLHCTWRPRGLLRGVVSP